MSSSADLVLFIFGIVAGVGALLAAIVALPKALVVIGHGIRAVFRWCVAAVKAVAVISTLPEKLQEIQDKQDGTAKTLAEHLADAKKNMGLLETIDARTAHMVPKVDEIHYEAKTNGGGSQRDAVNRIEEGVKGLYATAGEIGTAGRGRNHEE
jgi:hypothetical protein